MKTNAFYPMRDNIYKEGLIDLINYMGDTKGKTMIEIGSYAGESTQIFAQYFDKVISIDPFINDYDLNDPSCKYMDFEQVYQRFKENISEYKNIFHIRKTSDNAISDIDFKVDFVYIDGLHTYEQVISDINNYKYRINKDGYIAGHDYHPVWQGVVNAVNETIGKPDATFKDTSWIKKL